MPRLTANAGSDYFWASVMKFVSLLRRQLRKLQSCNVVIDNRSFCVWLWRLRRQEYGAMRAELKQPTLLLSTRAVMTQWQTQDPYIDQIFPFPLINQNIFTILPIKVGHRDGSLYDLFFSTPWKFEPKLFEMKFNKILERFIFH